VNYTKIAIRVTVMNEVQFLLASKPRKPLKPRPLYVKQTSANAPIAVKFALEVTNKGLET
jgi:hypothetical protein